MRPHRGNHLFTGKATGRIGLHGIVNWYDFITQPALHHGVAFLQGTQPSTHDLAH